MKIKDSWDSYRREVLPPNASEIQIQECRRAFYAEAVAYSALSNIDQVYAYKDELQKFKDDVLKGKA